ncbi:hypothetical protein KC952_02575 [Candidatus Saccharibacteria bacterium]|nr:hypothetical protein [Candidatus Saccharibacteria bacterium]
MSTQNHSPDLSEWVPISEQCQDAITSYLEERRPSVYGGVRAFLAPFGRKMGYNPDYVTSISTYIEKQLGSGERRITPASLLARQSLQTIVALNELSADHLPIKHRGFNFLPVDPTDDISTKLKRVVLNAYRMNVELGGDFFARKTYDGSGYFRAPIDDEFAVAVKGGSGAGTFSLDIALEYNKYGDGRDSLNPSHELWRTGIDTAELNNNESAIRIIRTGSGIKPDDSVKPGKITEFKKRYNTTPPRVLTFLAAHVMLAMRGDTGLALSSYGAETLSSLKKSNNRARTRYSEIHEGIGFIGNYNPYWHSMSDLPNNFYDQIVAQNDSEPGIQPHERHIIDLAIDAFNSLKNTENNPFRLKLCTDDPQSVVQSAVSSYTQGRFPY